MPKRKGAGAAAAAAAAWREIQEKEEKGKLMTTRKGVKEIDDPAIESCSAAIRE